LKQFNSYHTSIKQLAKRNRLPYKYSKSIDRSTLWRWKNKADDKYLGSELSNIDLLEQFLERKDSARVIRSYLRLTASISNILNTSNKFQKHINIKLIFRMCNISPSLFYHWKNQVINKCLTSPIKLCRKIYPY
jgi:hypothetical protein